MAKITISISEEAAKIIRGSPEINWNDIVKNSIENEAKRLKLKENY